MSRLPYVWGATDTEVADRYGCDDEIPRPDARLLRAVTVDAPPAVVFRWLCQLKVAPYSYDWLDNRGRRSPPRLVPGGEQVRLGEPVMTIFELRQVVADRSLTLRLAQSVPSWLFGDVAVTYDARPSGSGTRLVAALAITNPAGPLPGLRRRALAWADLLMMRKQLLTLGALAARPAT